MATSAVINGQIASKQVDAQAEAREALLKSITEAADGQSSASVLRNLAEAYAFVVAPDRSSVSANVKAAK